jgi:NADH-quinone oxidoreductase subunit L
MALALIVLAIGSIAAGYVALGSRFEHFLDPSFGLEAAPHAADEGLEMTLMVVSSVIAIAGIGIAAFFFLRNRGAAAALADRFRALHRLLLNKYYVDEIYDATVVQPVRIVSEDALWKRVDVHLIDGAVNGVGDIVSGSSDVLRRVQNGSVRMYAASVFLGAVAILGYYLWR